MPHVIACLCKAVHLCIRILPAGSACVKYKLYGYEIDEIFVCGIAASLLFVSCNMSNLGKGALIGGGSGGQQLVPV